MVIYQNPVIKSTSVKLFILDDSDFYILSEFAKKGEVFRTRIVLAKLEERAISRRIDNLHKNGYVILRKSKPYRKQPNKKTKIFGLSLKGFLASLHYCNVEDNYLTKKYLKEIKDKKLSKAVLNYLKDDLIHFLTHNYFRGIIFNKMNNIVNWIDDYYTVYGFGNKDLEYLEKLDDIRTKSWKKVYNSTPGKLIFHNYVDWWYGVIDCYGNGWNYDKILKETSLVSSTPGIEARNTIIQF